MPKSPTLHHPVHDLIAERWSPAGFAERAVEPELIRSLLEAARWAPSAYNEQPWAYIVAARREPEAFAAMLDCLVPPNQVWAQHAAVLMIGLARTTLRENGRPNRHALHDLGQASALLTMQATAHGLQVHQMGGIRHAAIAERYRVPPDVEIVTALAVGYPGGLGRLPDGVALRDRTPRTRRPQGAFAFAEVWGQGW